MLATAKDKNNNRWGSQACLLFETGSPCVSQEDLYLTAQPKLVSNVESACSSLSAGITRVSYSFASLHSAYGFPAASFILCAHVGT